MTERFTDKMARVVGNLQKMGEYNAPESDVMAYMQHEGVTGAQIRQYGAVNSAPQPEAPGAFASMGRGIQDVAAGVGQLTGTLPQVQNALTYFPGGASAGSMAGQTDQQAADAELQDVTQYEQAQGPGMDGWRVAGQAVGSSPLAALPGASAGAGLLARTGAGALAGGASGGLLYAKNGEERFTNTVGGAVGGGLFGAAAPALTKAAGKAAQFVGDVGRKANGLLRGTTINATLVRQAEDAAREAGVKLEDVGEAYTKRIALQAKQALDNGQPFDFKSAVQAAEAEKFGFAGEAAMTRGQATRNPQIFSNERNLAKRPQGQVLADRFNAQQANAERYMTDLAKAPDLDPIDAADGLRVLAKSRADAMQSKVGEAYRAVPTGGQFPSDSLKNRTGAILNDFEDKVSAGVKRRITELTSEESTRIPSMDELIKLDKLINDTMPPGSDLASDVAAGRLKKALIDVMGDAADAQGDEPTKQAYLAAKKMAAERFEKIGKRGGLVSQMVDGRIDPKDIPGKILGGKTDDLAHLKRFILDGENGEESWSVIQRMTENHIKDAATKSGDFSQAAYNNAIKGIKRHRLVQIFGEQRADELIGFGKTANKIFSIPPFHTVNVSNSAPELANIAGDALGALADAVPGGRLATGLLGKAAQKKALKEEFNLSLGLLGNQGPMTPRPNPLSRALPYAGASAGIGGLLGAQKTRR